MNRFPFLFAAAASALLASSTFAQEIEPSPPFTVAELTTHPRTGWITNGGNVFNQRYSPLDQIDIENVARLKAQWRTHLNGSGVGPQYSGQAQSLVYAGVLYIITGANDVFAIDVDSGEILWEYNANLDPENVNVCCGWTNRGVAMGDGRIYFGRLDARLVALDQTTGQVVWDIQAENPHEGFAITSPPLYYEGMLISGFSGSNRGIRGRLKAYDAATGELIWTFFTIPGPGEFGHETWGGDNDVWRYGGASVWQTPAADPELGLLYFSTGNAYPMFNGALRPGDNLFTASIVAIDAATGEYRWHFQTTHHDIWDYDGPNPVILFDAEIDGRARRGIAQIPKSGYLYLLDRTNGEPLFPIQEVPVPQEPGRATSPTQPIPAGEPILPHRIDITPEGWMLVNEGRTFTPLPMEGHVLYRPLAHVNWPPSAYDPQTHLMYICATDRIGVLQATDEDSSPAYVPYVATDTFSRTAVPGRGILTAVDLTTRSVAWQRQWVDRCFSGSVVTAGGLVFIGRIDGRLTALDKLTGNQLWQFDTGTGAGIHGAPTIFEHEGVQYVAAFAGGSIYADGASGDSVWLFSLNGEIDEPEPAITSAIEAVDEMPRDPVTAADVERGRAVYAQVCTACHGDTGFGGEGLGPALDNGMAAAEVFAVISAGRNLMPSFRSALSPEQRRDVAWFVTERLFEPSLDD
jgi:alcohol dehydrogenase (cytochrome c)